MIKFTRKGAYTLLRKLVNFATTYSQCCSASHLIYRPPCIADHGLTALLRDASLEVLCKRKQTDSASQTNRIANCRWHHTIGNHHDLSIAPKRDPQASWTRARRWSLKQSSRSRHHYNRCVGRFSSDSLISRLYRQSLCSLLQRVWSLLHVIFFNRVCSSTVVRTTEAS